MSNYTPCSLAEAFERPVPPSDNGYLSESLQRLATHYCTLVNDYDLNDRAMLYYRVDMEGTPLLKPLARAQSNGSIQTPPAAINSCFEKAATLRDMWTFLHNQVPVDVSEADEG